jgi:hypothetical protein
VRGHGAIQVREVWEDVFHSGELLRGAHEGVQVIRDGVLDEGWGEVALAPAVSRPRSRRSFQPGIGKAGWSRVHLAACSR